ncbi:hypothetical protein VKT23_020427 [Stygiomarasmius scandens]|uniref:PH domain-containing protein n=1 Tax=Marasmiellus scandens TaxID=2682957 RepID=A0ABR1IJB4_9AGAR
MEFPYLKSNQELEDFDAWINSLNNEHVSAWWKHKRINKWIIPTIIQSQSKMDPSDWAITESTTNIGEGQHYWSRKETGEKLSLVASIIEARKLDFRVANEIMTTRKTGVLGNNHNSAFNCMKNSQRRVDSSMARRQANQERDTKISQLQQEVQGHTEAKKTNEARLKQAREALALARSTRTDGKTQARTVRAESSSSGRVRVLSSKGKGRATDPESRESPNEWNIPTRSSSFIPSDLTDHSLVPAVEQHLPMLPQSDWDQWMLSHDTDLTSNSNFQVSSDAWLPFNSENGSQDRFDSLSMPEFEAPPVPPALIPGTLMHMFYSNDNEDYSTNLYASSSTAAADFTFLDTHVGFKRPGSPSSFDDMFKRSRLDN